MTGSTPGAPGLLNDEGPELNFCRMRDSCRRYKCLFWVNHQREKREMSHWDGKCVLVPFKETSSTNREICRRTRIAFTIMIVKKFNWKVVFKMCLTIMLLRGSQGESNSVQDSQSSHSLSVLDDQPPCNSITTVYSIVNGMMIKVRRNQVWKADNLGDSSFHCHHQWKTLSNKLVLASNFAQTDSVQDALSSLPKPRMPLLLIRCWFPPLVPSFEV